MPLPQCNLFSIYQLRVNLVLILKSINIDFMLYILYFVAKIKYDTKCIILLPNILVCVEYVSTIIN